LQIDDGAHAVRYSAGRAAAQGAPGKGRRARGGRMKQRNLGVIPALAIAAAVLAGCASGPDFKRPDPPYAERYTAQKLQVEASGKDDAYAQHVVRGAELSHDWCLLFKSDALDDVVKRALAGNRTLVAAASTLAQAQ